MALAWDDGRLLRGARGRYLRAHRLCERCLANGVERMAKYVDFIEAPGRDKEKYWDRNNWIALCVRCEREDHAAQLERWEKEKADELKAREERIRAEDERHRAAGDHVFTREEWQAKRKAASAALHKGRM